MNVHFMHAVITQQTTDSQLTSFFKSMLNLVILAHHVCMSNVNSIVLLELPIAELGVELVGRGVK